MQATGDYMNLSLGDFASDLYGPTALTGGVAVIYLQHTISTQIEARNGLRGPLKSRQRLMEKPSTTTIIDLVPIPKNCICTPMPSCCWY